MGVENLNKILNDFFVKSNNGDNAILDNLELFYELSELIEYEFDEYFTNNEESVDKNITKIGLFDNIELVKEFYKKYNIDFDIDKVLNDGTIDFKDDHYSNNGISYHENNHKLVDSCNNGLVTDSLVLIHELSHLRNQPEERRNEISDLLTESISITTEFIYDDFLEQKGYNTSDWKLETYNYYYNLVKNIKPVYKMLLLYKELGDVSLESYRMLYENDKQYNENLQSLIYASNINPTEFYIMSRYIFSFPLSIYMYDEYKKDNSFFNNIEKLNYSINDENKNMYDCLKIINLENLDIEDQNKIEESFQNVLKTLITQKDTKKR